MGNILEYITGGSIDHTTNGDIMSTSPRMMLLGGSNQFEERDTKFQKCQMIQMILVLIYNPNFTTSHALLGGHGSPRT
jgi:hypothetical protein